MKTSTFLLSIVGFCIFYICNADWLDKLYERVVEDFLGADYEEVAPFISSVSAGAEEFDNLIEELARSKRKWYHPSGPLSCAILVTAFSILAYQMFGLSGKRGLLKKSQDFLIRFCQSQNSQMATSKEEIQNFVMEFLESKFKSINGKKTGDDVPVKLLWKGGTLVESSIHCNIRDDLAESKILHMQKHLLQSKLLVKCADLGRGDEKVQVSPNSSEESTASKIAEIRRLLESEPELMNFLDTEGAESEKTAGSIAIEETSTASDLGKLSTSGHQRRNPYKKVRKSVPQPEIAEEDLAEMTDGVETFETSVGRCSSDEDKNLQVDSGKDSDTGYESIPDSKLMNRIRLLETRLRLEELKNKNWINRMSRAEGILQQLNKQVERIEESRPMATRTQTLKITSTVTNWASPSHPTTNTQFSLVNQYQPYYLQTQTPSMSLSEVIKKEIGLPTQQEYSMRLYSIAPTPPIPALSSPNVIIPQPSFLSKFLSR